MKKAKKRWEKIRQFILRNLDALKLIGMGIGMGVIGYCFGVDYMSRKCVNVPKDKFNDLIHNAYDIGIEATYDYIDKNVPEANKMINEFSNANPDLKIVIPEASVRAAEGSIILK